jgi:hypothetical protein
LFFAFLGLSFSIFISSPSSIVSKNNEELILVYSQHCPACQKVLEISKNLNIPLKKVPLNQAFPLVRILNLKSLPCLLEVKEGKIEIYSNLDKIIQKLNIKKIETNCGRNEEGICVIP